MHFAKRFNKAGFIKAATDGKTDWSKAERTYARLQWENVDNTKNDDITEYFYLTDNDRPLGENGPHLFNGETGDTFGFDRQQIIDTNTNTFTCSLQYDNNFQKFQTDCTPDWSAFTPVYDTTYESAYADGGKNASSYGGTWETVATNFTGSEIPWARVDIRALKRSEKYYFFIFYLFHYTSYNTYAKGKVCCYRGNVFTTFSSQSMERASDLIYKQTDGKTAFQLYNTSSTKITAAAEYIRIHFNYKRTASGSAANSYVNLYPCTPYYTTGTKVGVTWSNNAYYGENPNAYVDLTNPSNYKAINSRLLYRELDTSMPVVANCWSTAVSSDAIKWSYSYTYYVRHVESPITRTGSSTISTPAGCEFDHFELVYANQYQYTASARFYFRQPGSSELLLKTLNENISSRARNYMYKLVDRIKEDYITLEFTVRLRPKTSTVKSSMAAFLKAYTYSATVSVESLTHATIVGS